MASNSQAAELPDSVSVPIDGRILFFKRDRNQFFFLSHFHAADFEIDGEVWPTVEHFFQAQKSFDHTYGKAIRACHHPGMAKRLGAAPEGSRKHSKDSWFRANGLKHRTDWRDVRLDIMRRADLAKFSQHPRLAALLLSTGSAEIVEDTALDDFWGIGPDGAGGNWAGRILTEIREQLRESLQTIS